ncbi:MAG TPA: 16S rRNA (cytosine(967)-C(5))-methyltransferase RsmB [Pyrinomonadaceae bacterium]
MRIVKRGAKPGGASRKVSPARRAASEILRRVEDEGAFAAPLLAGLPATLTTEDRALCYELTLGVLRRQLWLDRALEHFSGRQAGKLDAPVRRALRLGLFQLRFLSRIPAHAAVNESVNAAHASGFRSAAPFINAVLRRATREPDFDPAALVEDPLEKIAVETSHPPWLIRRWAEAFGREEAAGFARANNDSAPASFRVNTLDAGEERLVEDLRNSGVVVTPSLVAPGAWRLEGGGGASAAVRTLAGEGRVYMQDEASQLVAHVVGARPGERVLDACAAPGSKTTHVAALADDRARVVAGELHAHRLRLLAETCRRLGARGVSVVGLNAEAALPFADGAFDRVLVDAPCTGTGTLRHNPEIRWRLARESFRELASVQSRILSEAARVVRRGGRLVYSTCSVEREENEDVVAAFLHSNPDFKQVEAAPAPAALLLPDGAARTWPHRDDVDGFYVAAVEKQ